MMKKMKRMKAMMTRRAQPRRKINSLLRGRIRARMMKKNRRWKKNRKRKRRTRKKRLKKIKRRRM
jgi:hypothetical protein